MNTVIGAGIKVGANLLNYWLEQKKQDQMILAARDAEMLKALIDNQNKRADDPFVKDYSKNFIYVNYIYNVLSYDFLCHESTYNL